MAAYLTRERIEKARNLKLAIGERTGHPSLKTGRLFSLQAWSPMTMSPLPDHG